MGGGGGSLLSGWHQIIAGHGRRSLSWFHSAEADGEPCSQQFQVLKNQSASPEQQVCQHRFSYCAHPSPKRIGAGGSPEIMSFYLVRCVSCQAIMGGDDRSPSRGKWRPQTCEQRTQRLPTGCAAKSSQGN